MSSGYSICFCKRIANRPGYAGPLQQTILNDFEALVGRASFKGKVCGRVQLCCLSRGGREGEVAELAAARILAARVCQMGKPS